jgi:tetratricopeptide (TPR) repeat protein
MMRTYLSMAAIAVSTLALGACATSLPAGEQGQALYNTGNYLAAAEAFTEAVRLRPHSAVAWNNRAVARVRLGDLNGALRDYNRAVELAPEDAELYFNRGNALVAAGQYQAAIMDYDRAIQISPMYSRALFNRGTAHSLAAHHDAARRDWQAAIAAEPDPYARSAMRRSAGLEPAVAAATPPPAGEPTTASTIAPPPPPGTAPGAVPLPVTPPAPTVAGVTPSEPAASPMALDARALTTRAVSRELDGDHVGAMHDLNAALAIEPDARRREAIERLIRQLGTPR